MGFQAEKEKIEQESKDNYIINYIIPTSTDLRVKYLIENPTEYIDDNSNNILQIILEGFDNWNKGIKPYLDWVDSTYDANAKSSSLDERDRTIAEFKEEMEQLCSNEKIEKLYFDNILIRDNWAALHYRYRRTILETDEISFGDRMQFLKFEMKDGGLKITGSWIQ